MLLLSNMIGRKCKSSQSERFKQEWRNFTREIMFIGFAKEGFRPFD